MELGNKKNEKKKFFSFFDANLWWDFTHTL